MRFCDTTAHEMATYAGPKYCVTVTTHLTVSGQVLPIRHDLEEPTIDGLKLSVRCVRETANGGAVKVGRPIVIIPANLFIVMMRKAEHGCTDVRCGECEVVENLLD